MRLLFKIVPIERENHRIPEKNQYIQMWIQYTVLYIFSAEVWAQFFKRRIIDIFRCLRTENIDTCESIFFSCKCSQQKILCWRACKIHNTHTKLSACTHSVISNDNVDSLKKITHIPWSRWARICYLQTHTHPNTIIEWVITNRK